MKHSKWILVAVCSAAFACGAAFAKDKKEENKYPHATRAEPKTNMSSGDQRALNKAADLVNDNKGAEAEPMIRKVLEGNGSAYAQSFAHQLMAQIYWDQEKGAEAIDEYKKAVALNGLPNDAHFQVLYALAQTQIQEEKYQDALTTLAEWEQQTGAQNADELALKANAHYRLDQFQPAVDTMKKAMSMTDKPNDSWSQILMASYFELNQYGQAAELVKGQLAKDPKNKKLVNQLATIYIQGDKDQEALALMAKAKADGLVSTGDDYVQLAKMYASADKPKDAATTMKEGFASNVVQPSYDNYKLLGDVCTQAEEDACAIEGYGKASPMAKDGNVDYQLGYLYYYSDKSKDAVDALNRAISRGGLRQEGEAHLLRGDAENDLGQSAAAMADWQKASSFASTKTMAEQRIKAAKGGAKISRAKKK